MLGKGHFAVVKKCRDTLTGQTYAVKIIDKKEMVKSTAGVVKQEIEILRAVGAHPNIVQLIDHFEDSTKHYLVMEVRMTHRSARRACNRVCAGTCRAQRKCCHEAR